MQIMSSVSAGCCACSTGTGIKIFVLLHAARHAVSVRNKLTDVPYCYSFCKGFATLCRKSE